MKRILPVISGVLLAVRAAAYQEPSTARIAEVRPLKICETAIAAAEAENGIPRGMLLAVGLNESGLHGVVWPWTLNVDGRSIFADNAEDMQRHLWEELRAGARNIDVSCMQVSLKHHHSKVANWAQLLDPRQNARYAAQVLANEYQRRKSWHAAAGAYHTGDPHLRAVYACEVSLKYAKIIGMKGIRCSVPAPARSPSARQPDRSPSDRAGSRQVEAGR